MTIQPPSMSAAPTAIFANDAPDARRGSVWNRLAGKATRFVARNIRTKTLAMRNARPMVSFTFDDAMASAGTVGAAVLERRGIHGTYYISGGGCGEPSACGRITDTGEIRTLWQHGHEIACHTFSHAAVSRLDAPTLKADIARNRDFFAAIHPGITVDNFAFPYGDISLSAKLQLQRHFKSCRSIQPGINTKTLDLGAMKCVALQSSTMTADDIAAAVAETVRRNGWLIFFSHDVDPSPTAYGVTPALLDIAVAAALAAGCVAVTVAKGLAHAAGEPFEAT
jgi:peptidoglycan/xylan/chitin deacetylase (PgdA/CDA1 family)